MALQAKDYPDLPSLIRALKVRYHKNKLYPMAAKIGVALGTVQMWENGMIKQPTVPTLRLLADAYGLDLGELTSLPPSRSPKPRKGANLVRAAKAVLACVCLLGLGGVPAEGGTLGVVQLLEKIVSYQTLSNRLVRWLLPLRECPA